MKSEPLFLKIAFPTFLISLFFISVIYFQVMQERKNNQNFQINQVKHQVALLKNIVEDELNSVEQDLILLSNESVFTQYLAQSTESAQAAIELSWQNMLAAHSNIQQIRFIDRSGIEQIRVERHRLTQQIVTSDDKQNKLNRNYVQAGFELVDRDIMTSEFDLNKEFGEIERPLNPTIRFIKRFDKAGEQSGILVINYSSSALFDELDTLIDHRVSILNSQGYYLQHNDVSKNWGWLLNRTDANLAKESPQLWQTISQLTDSTTHFDDNTVYGKIRLQPEQQRTKHPTLIYTYSTSNNFIQTSSFNLTLIAIVLIATGLFLSTMAMLYANLKALAVQRDLATSSNEKAQNALEAKSTFLANMSHEIRTPLNGIMGFFQLLELESLNKKQHEFAQNGLKSTRLLSQIVNDILDYSKLEANKMTLQNSVFSLEAMMNDIGLLMSSSLKEKRLEFWLDIEQDINVLGDETRIRQVLNNLVNNAIKFTDEGFVKIKLTQTDLCDDRVTVKFEVIDSGIGINQEQLSRIFNSFEQANMNTTKKYGGTGLGLSISQNILLLMGSSLEVSSEPMVGSTFWFELSLSLAKSKNLHLSNSTTQYVNKHLLKQQHILFYSESAIGKNIFNKMCDNFDWECLHASSIDQVLSMLDENMSNEAHPRINIVVVNKNEINDSTWDELRQIKQQITSDDEPLIYLMCTLTGDLGFALEDYQQQLIDGYFIKPITPSHFYEEIASQLLDKYDNQPAAGHIQYDFSQLHILLVEDNFINQEVARNMLENLHIKVSIVEDGQQAVETLTAQPHEFDIIFMDMQMPVMDGIAATKFIRHTLNLTDVPIIAMTANAMVSDQKTCRDAGMNDHLAKPFDQDMLTEIIIANLPNA